MVPGIRSAAPNSSPGSVRQPDPSPGLSSFDLDEPSLMEQINTLRKELRLVQHRAEMFEAERDNAQHNTGIWQRKVEEQQDLIAERDKAIENLVNVSLQQEHLGSPIEIRQLKQAHGIMSRELEEQEAKVQNHQMVLKDKDQAVQKLQEEVERLNTMLADREKEIAKRVKHEQEERGTKLQRLQHENETQQLEMRELKRQLWDAKGVTANIFSLEHALKEARDQLRQLKATRQAAIDQATRNAQEEVREEIKAAQETHKLIERRITEMEEMQKKIDAEPKVPEENVVVKDLEAKVGRLLATLDAKDTLLKSAQAKAQRLELMQTTANKEADSHVESLIEDLETKEKLLAALATKASRLESALEIDTSNGNSDAAVESLLAQLEYKDTIIRTLEAKNHQLDIYKTSTKMEFDVEMEGLEGKLRYKDTMIKTFEAKVQQLEIANVTAEQDLELVVKNLQSQMKNVQELEEKVSCLQKTVGERDAMLEEAVSKAQHRDQESNNTKQELVEQIASLRAQNEEASAHRKEAQESIEKLQASLEEATTAKKRLQEELSTRSKSIQDEVEQALKARQASEKSIVQNYDRQLSDLASDKGLIIENLRKDLIDLRAKRAEETTELNMKLTQVRSEFDEVREDCDLKVRMKEQHIEALELTLHAQENTVDTMRSEMDQLQKSMTDAAAARKKENDELQKEIMSSKNTAAELKKEVVSLQMQLKEEKLVHSDQVVSLKETIADLEDEIPKVKAAMTGESMRRMTMVKERLDQLSDRNKELQNENKELGSILDKSIKKIQKMEKEKKKRKEKADRVALERNKPDDPTDPNETMITEDSSLPDYEQVNISIEGDSSTGATPSSTSRRSLDAAGVKTKRRSKSRPPGPFKRILLSRQRSAPTKASVFVNDIDEEDDLEKPANKKGGMMFF